MSESHLLISELLIAASDSKDEATGSSLSHPALDKPVGPGGRRLPSRFEKNAQRSSKKLESLSADLEAMQKRLEVLESVRPYCC